MCAPYKRFVLMLWAVWTRVTTAIEPPQPITCTLTASEDCPANSVCTKIGTEYFGCVCAQDYELNPASGHLLNVTDNNFFPYCRSVNESDDVPANKKTKLLVYIRSPAKAEHLVFGILLVLLAAVLAVAGLYIIKILHPLQRTRVAYVQMKRRRRQHQRLEEEFDGIAMERRDSKTVQYY